MYLKAYCHSVQGVYLSINWCLSHFLAPVSFLDPVGYPGVGYLGGRVPRQDLLVSRGCGIIGLYPTNHPPPGGGEGYFGIFGTHPSGNAVLKNNSTFGSMVHPGKEKILCSLPLNNNAYILNTSRKIIWSCGKVFSFEQENQQVLVHLFSIKE